MQKDLGKEFLEACEQIFEVRASRYNQYGDAYLEDDYMFLQYQVLNKMKRLKIQMSLNNGKEIINNKDVALDSAIDAANYAIFIVAKLLKEKTNE